MLNLKQKLTIKHLNEYNNVTDPKEVVKFCIEKLDKPRAGRIKYNGEYTNRRIKKSQGRKHSRTHYQGIINHIAQSNELEH